MPGTFFMLWIAGLVQLYGPPAVVGEHLEVRDLTFTVIETGEELKLDIFYPPLDGELRPAVVFIHGGAWNLNDKSDYHDFARAFSRNGMIGITPQYRFDAAAGLFDQVADIKTAIRWAKQEGAAYGIDPERIGLYGSSSGGHLAALAGTALDGEGFVDDGDLGDSSVDAAYYLFGIYRMESDSPIVIISDFLNPGMPLGISPEFLPVFSPLNYVNGNEAPTFIMNGQRDRYVPIEEARAFRDAYAQAGVPVTLLEIPHLGHGFIKTRPWLRPLIYLSVRDYFSLTLSASEN